MLKTAMLLCAVCLIAMAPAAEASCHFCPPQVVEACTQAVDRACLDAAVHMALHADEVVIGIAQDPDGFLCHAAELQCT